MYSLNRTYCLISSSSHTPLTLLYSHRIYTLINDIMQQVS